MGALVLTRWASHLRAEHLEQRNNVGGCRRGIDGAVWVRTLTVQGWTDWYPIGGLAESDPDVRMGNGNDATILVRGVDGHLWRASASDTTWYWDAPGYGD